MIKEDIDYALELRKQYARDKADYDDLHESFKATEALLRGNTPVGDDFSDAVAYYMELAEELNKLASSINENVSLYNEIVGA